MELTVRPEPEFIWVANNWVWPDNEQREEGLILYVPLVPPVDPLDHAAALADYYRQRPGLLVSSTSGAVSGDLNLNAFRFNDRIANEFTDRLSGAGGIGNVTLASQASPGRGFIPNEVDFLDFGGVLTSLMAKAWARSPIFGEHISARRVCKPAPRIAGRWPRAARA